MEFIRAKPYPEIDFDSPLTAALGAIRRSNRSDVVITRQNDAVGTLNIIKVLQCIADNQVSPQLAIADFAQPLMELSADVGIDELLESLTQPGCGIVRWGTTLVDRDALLLNILKTQC